MKKPSQRKIYVSCDLCKAYDSVRIPDLFQILDSRATLPSDKHLVELMKAIYGDRQVSIGKHTFKPQCGVM